MDTNMEASKEIVEQETDNEEAVKLTDDNDSQSDGDNSGAKGGCGWGRFRPKILQPLATVWTFLTLYVVFSFTHGVQGSYTISVLTTLEKRFNLPSSLSGSLVTVSMVGYLISVIFVSFFFAKKHPPRLFACCMLLTSLCAILYVIPHFIYGTGNDDIDIAHLQKQNHPLTSNSSEVVSGSGRTQFCHGSGEGSAKELPLKRNCSESQIKSADDDVTSIKPAIAMFALSEILQGVSGAPIWTVGLAYLDDNTNPELSAKLIGIMYAVRFLSPMVSFGMGGYLLSIYANLKETDLSPQHPQWIGAWWLGYFVCSIINLCICLPTSMIPKNLKPIKNSSSKGKKEAKKLPAEERKDPEESDVVGMVTEKLIDDSNRQTKPDNIRKHRKSIVEELSVWKELPKAVLRLVTNPIYVLSCLTVCIDCFVLGFITFLPKYVEVYFRQTAWVASLLGGMTPAVFGGCGSLIGGLISGKIKGSDGGVAGNCRVTFVMSLLSFFLLIPAMLLSCPDVDYAGSISHKRLNVTTECSLHCGCSSDPFDPVCGSDGISYFSPCHAGCLAAFNSTDNRKELSPTIRSSGCRCVSVSDDDGGIDGSRGVVVGGICDGYCASLIPYVISAVSIFVSINLYNVPYTNIILRCIREDDKSFALGLQLVVVCFSIFPAPMMYGSLFESSCILRETSICSDKEGPCLLYDRNTLRLAFHGLTLGLRAISTSLYLSTYLLARRNLRLLEQNTLQNGVKQELREENYDQEIRETVL